MRTWATSSYPRFVSACWTVLPSGSRMEGRKVIEIVALYMSDVEWYKPTGDDDKLGAAVRRPPGAPPEPGS